MANTVNGIAAITTDAQRERINVTLNNALRAIEPGTVLRARLALTAVGDFVVDDPTVANPMSNASGNSPGQSIFVVGCEYSAAAAGELIFKSKVGAASAITTSDFNLAVNSGILLPLGRGVMAPTDAGGQLIVNASSAMLPVNITLYYIIADRMYLGGAM